MNTGIAKKLLPLAVPLGLLILTEVFFLRIDRVPASLSAAVQYLSYAVFLFAMVLSCWFNRSRILFVSAVLMMGQLALTLPAPAGAYGIFYRNAVYSAASLLIPLNILVFSLLRERGIVTPWGKARIGFILAQVLFIIPSVRGSGEPVLFFSRDIFPAKLFSLTPIPHLPLLVFLVAFTVLTARLLLNSSPLEGSFVGVLLASAFALHLKDQVMAVPVFFLGAAIMLVTAVLQDSYSKAYLDELTGIPGRRALAEEMAKLGGRYTIAMLDIDFFKQFNDTYGHDVGDEALKFIASMIRDVGGGGRAFRYGGEEFAIIFPGRRLDDAAPHLEDLRKAIARRPFTLRGKDRPKKKPKQVKPGRGPLTRVYITVSIGAAEKNSRLLTSGEVMTAADEALYRAKSQGRNQVSL